MDGVNAYALAVNAAAAAGGRVGTAEGKRTDKDGRVRAHGTTTCLIYEH